jgi:hypothetical protein
MSVRATPTVEKDSKMESDVTALADMLKQYEELLSVFKRDGISIYFLNQNHTLLNDMLHILTKLNKKDLFVHNFKTNQV